jgi:hypothetical protein
LTLRHALATDEGTPPARAPGTLLFAAWNLREFDSDTWGARAEKSYAHIAETVARFDLSSRAGGPGRPTGAERLRFRLGPHWSYLVSDVTEGRAGNQERLVFLYDTRKVCFLGIAGEFVLPAMQSGRGSMCRGVAPSPRSRIDRAVRGATYTVGAFRAGQPGLALSLFAQSDSRLSELNAAPSERRSPVLLIALPQAEVWVRSRSIRSMVSRKASARRSDHVQA